MQYFKKPLVRTLLYIFIGAVLIGGAYYLVVHNHYYLRRRDMRQMQTLISSYRYFSPLVVVSLILISTIIPPLPLPVPLVEIAAGMVFGFWQGFLIVWFSQIVSSVLVFYLMKYFHTTLFKGLLKNKVWNTYRRFLDQKGALAVFILRTTLSAPFNIVSFLAGLSKMKDMSFIMATILGTIFESVLYSFIGSKIKTIHFSFKYLSLLILVTGIAGFVFTFIVMKLLHRRK